jgi:flagellum-specific peptidoglycan hydrolase FlgJ
MIRFISVVIFLSSLNINAVNPSLTEKVKLNYINEYKDIAIAEMYRTGIPASIILAQGLLESQSGTSDLAINANNHFGIKCKSYWQGSTYFHKDDDYDKNGNIIKSCFRYYDSPLESYVDHSNFLVQSPNYSNLFNLPKDDFAAWAWGLKKSGYATDKMYAVKLIKLIQEFQLYKYDEAKNPWNYIIK